MEHEIKLVTVPKFIMMLTSEKKVKEEEMHRFKQVADNLIQLQTQHEEHFFSAWKRLSDVYLQSTV